MTSSSNPLPALGVAELRRAATTRPARPGEQAHIGEGEEDQPLGLDAGEPRREHVAPERVDAPPDHRAGGDELVERDQRTP